MTKREYQKKLTELEDFVVSVNNDIESWHKELDAGVVTEDRNYLYDCQYDLLQSIADLESEWSRRDWTAADYATHSLIANNID